MTTTLPKAAQELVDDAKAAGLTVTVDTWGNGLSIWVENPALDADASLVWQTTLVGGTTGRLGFVVQPGKPAMRFDYCNARSGRKHTAPKSVRQARAILGLSI